MSILEAYWPSSRSEFGKILVDSYEKFDTDFIIRSALMLYGDVVKSNINKGIAETLKNDWSEFKRALKNLVRLLLKIDVRHFLSSWNVLLPIIYYIYYNLEYRNNIKAVRAYLLRAIFFTYFQSGTTGKLQQMKSYINSFDHEITIEMLDQINDLRVTEGEIEDVLNSEKGSRVAGEVLYYMSLDWRNKSFKYEQDHLHPASRFDNSKPHTISMDVWKKWRSMRNKLPNLHLLEGRSNGSKNDIRLIDYYNDMNNEQKARFHEVQTFQTMFRLNLETSKSFMKSARKFLQQRFVRCLDHRGSVKSLIYKQSVRNYTLSSQFQYGVGIKN